MNNSFEINVKCYFEDMFGKKKNDMFSSNMCVLALYLVDKFRAF
jgi:hypothetical protein